MKPSSLKTSLVVVFTLAAGSLLSQERVLPAESAIVSTGQATIKGKVVPYKVTAGTQPVWDLAYRS